jgi:hypothetical protein
MLVIVILITKNYSCHQSSPIFFWYWQSSQNVVEKLFFLKNQHLFVLPKLYVVRWGDSPTTSTYSTENLTSVGWVAYLNVRTQVIVCAESRLKFHPLMHNRANR